MNINHELKDAIKEFRAEMERIKDIPVINPPSEPEHEVQRTYVAPDSNYGHKLEELIENLHARGIPRDQIESVFSQLSFSPYDENIPDQVKKEMITRMELVVERLDYLERVHEQRKLERASAPAPSSGQSQDQDFKVDSSPTFNRRPSLSM